jgi:hypothetical protein
LAGLSRDLDRIDEAFFETGGVTEVAEGSFRVTVISERTAAFFRGFFSVFIEGKLGSAAVLESLRGPLILEENDGKGSRCQQLDSQLSN